MYRTLALFKVQSCVVIQSVLTGPIQGNGTKQGFPLPIKNAESADQGLSRLPLRETQISLRLLLFSEQCRKRSSPLCTPSIVADTKSKNPDVPNSDMVGEENIPSQGVPLRHLCTPFTIADTGSHLDAHEWVGLEK